MSPLQQAISPSNRALVRRPSGADRRVAVCFGVVAVGYLVFHRSFAYLGVPALGLYVGELTFAVAVLHAPSRRALVGSVRWLVEPGPYHPLAWALLLQLAYGLFQCARGQLQGTSLVELSKFAVFNLYPLALLLGLWAARSVPDFLPRFVIAFAWANGVLALAFLLFLDRLGLSVPGQPGVPLNIGDGAAFALVGLVCFVPKVSSRWYLLAANGAGALGAQSRAQWIAVAVSLLVWAVLTGRLRRMAAGVAAAFAGLGLLGLAGLDIPTASTRGGSSSLAGLAGRLLATFDPSAAQHLVGETSMNVGVSTRWRSDWWSAIWHGVHGSADRMFIGYGYGFPLNRLTAYVPDDTRTPHDVVLYALGYGGWFGVVVLVAFHATIGALLWKVWKLTGQPFGFLCWIVAVTIALFSNWFEAPFGAFPCFFIFGMALAPLALLPRRDTAIAIH
jgi:hypothetical protein